ncbi:MAG: hypothetical protein QW578_05715 [Thermoplasmatales archaeon]
MASHKIFAENLTTGTTTSITVTKARPTGSFAYIISENATDIPYGVYVTAINGQTLTLSAAPTAATTITVVYEGF